MAYPFRAILSPIEFDDPSLPAVKPSTPRAAGEASPPGLWQ